MAPKSCNPQTILNKASFSCVLLMVHQEATMPNNTTFEGLCSLNLSFSTLLDRWHQFLCLVNAWRNKRVKHENQLASIKLPNQKKSSRIRITLNMQIIFLDRNPNLWGSFSLDFVVPSSVIPPLFKMFLFCKFQLSQNSKSHLVRRHPCPGQKHPQTTSIPNSVPSSILLRKTFCARFFFGLGGLMLRLDERLDTC